METVQLFKIGGVYRDGYGDINRIDSAEGDRARVSMFCPTGKWESYAFNFRLSDGRYERTAHDEGNALHLIPGELHCINGEWVPMADNGGGSSCITNKPAADPSETRDAKAITARLSAGTAEPKRFDPFKGFAVTSDTTDQPSPKQAPTQRLADLEHPCMATRLLRG